MAAGTLAACSSDAAAAPRRRQTTDPRAGTASSPRSSRSQAGPLNIGYAEDGPANGQPVILLHGWPYDIFSYVDVAPILAAAGYRVIIPYLRGYGRTTFLSAQTVRNGQQAAIALDVVALMDALQDRQGRARRVRLGLPDGRRASPRCGRSGQGGRRWSAGTSSPTSRRTRSRWPRGAELGWWYQYYFATERGRAGYTANRHDFNKLIWKTASPAWNFDDATYDRSAEAFDNPDHVAIVIHNYRWRLSLAPGEPQYEAYEQKLQAAPPITGPGDHHRQRLRRRGQGRHGLPQQVHRQVRAPDPRRHRPQRAAGGAEAVRPSDPRRRPHVTLVSRAPRPLRAAAGGRSRWRRGTARRGSPRRTRRRTPSARSPAARR